MIIAVGRPAALVSVAVLLAPTAAAAHGFGQRYDLPVPLDMFLWGAALTVALSFVAAALFLRHGDENRPGWQADLLMVPGLRSIGHPAPSAILRAVVFAIFLFVLVAGFFGEQNPFKNIAPTTIWVLWWVGFAYISALIGDIWRLVSPFDTGFRWATAAYRAATGAELSRHRPYPDRLDAWPAVVLFYLFAWCELVWGGADRPSALATVIVIYALITWAGMWWFGRETWRARGEAFALVFGLFARFAPLAADRDADGTGRLWLRPYAVGLLVREPISPARTVLAIMVLATVSFDGFGETALWQSTLQALLTAPGLGAALFDLQQAGFNAGSVVMSFVLIAVPALFYVVFLLVCRLSDAAAAMVRDGGAGVRSTIDIAGLFVLTLVPIAIAYHLSHYLSYLLIAGQYAIPIASDPLGLGWNLFGTKLYLVDVGIVTARFVWYFSVAAIVLGHVAAVWLAHRMALRTCANAHAALCSQLPMVLLMIGYTMISLWIIAQPIVAD